MTTARFLWWVNIYPDDEGVSIHQHHQRYGDTPDAGIDVEHMKTANRRRLGGSIFRSCYVFAATPDEALSRARSLFSKASIGGRP